MYTAHLDIDVRTSTMMYSCIDVVVGGAFIILLLKKEYDVSQLGLGFGYE